MSGSVNKVILVGNLGRDAELRHTPGGSAVATLNLATTEKWNDKQSGEMKEAATCIIHVVGESGHAPTYKTAGGQVVKNDTGQSNSGDVLLYNLMAQPPTTLYSNVVNIRLTPSEFVLEFGAHFPDRPNQTPPSDFRPDVRVVMPAAALPGLLKAMSQTAAQRQQQQAAASVKPPPGFQGPPPDKDKQ